MASGIDFLTAAGHITDERRQEFILLSDVLGLSMQTIAINNEAVGEATEATVVGAFYVEDSPQIQLGGDLAFGARGEPCWVEGVVRGTDGEPISAARIDVWEADEDGFYDVQYADERVAASGRLFTDAKGRYRFWAVTPTPYPISADGPVGALLHTSGPLAHARLPPSLQGHRRRAPNPRYSHLRGRVRVPRPRQRLWSQGITRQGVRATGARNGGTRWA